MPARIYFNFWSVGGGRIAESCHATNTEASRSGWFCGAESQDQDGREMQFNFIFQEEPFK